MASIRRMSTAVATLLLARAGVNAMRVDQRKIAEFEVEPDSSENTDLVCGWIGQFKEKAAPAVAKEVDKQMGQLVDKVTACAEPQSPECKREVQSLVTQLVVVAGKGALLTIGVPPKAVKMAAGLITKYVEPNLEPISDALYDLLLKYLKNGNGLGDLRDKMDEVQEEVEAKITKAILDLKLCSELKKIPDFDQNVEPIVKAYRLYQQGEEWKDNAMDAIEDGKEAFDKVAGNFDDAKDKVSDHIGNWAKKNLPPVRNWWR